MNYFSYCIHTGRFEEGIKAFEEHQNFLRKNKSISFLKNTFYFQYFYLHFGIQRYDEALGYLNDWLQLKSNEEREDFQALARVLTLLIHKEMGNIFQIQSLVRSASRYLQNNSNTTKYEEAVLIYFKRSIKDVDKQDEIKNLSRLLESVRQIKSKGTDSNLMNLFDLEVWVISKLNNIPLKDVIQRRYN